MIFARRAAKAVVGSVPIAGAVLSEIADACVPNRGALDRERWEGDVTDGVNELRGRVAAIDERTGERIVSLNGASALIAKHMIEHCADGLMRDRVTLLEVQGAYSELASEELVDGFGELDSYGLITSRTLINAPNRYRLSQAGYEKLDDPIMGWNTKNDAHAVAALVVNKRENIRVAELERELGWPRRRLNPALRIVVNFINPGRVSKSAQSDYVTGYFSPNNAKLAQLRRFAAGG